MGRKTVKITTLIKEVNGMLAGSTCTKETREGMIAVLERILLDTDNYKGFRYLSESEVPAFEKPGIRIEICSIETGLPDQYKDTDHTRVAYFQ